MRAQAALSQIEQSRVNGAKGLALRLCRHRAFIGSANRRSGAARDWLASERICLSGPTDLTPFEVCLWNQTTPVSARKVDCGRGAAISAASRQASTGQPLPGRERP